MTGNQAQRRPRSEPALRLATTAVGPAVAAVNDAEVAGVWSAILTIDKDGRVVSESEAATALFGGAPRTGLSLDDIMPGWRATALGPCIAAVLAHAVSSAADVRLPACERHLEVHCVPTPQGGACLFLRDVAAQRAAEAERRRQTERAFAILDSIPQIIFACDARGLVRYLSPQWSTFTGSSVVAGLGRGWLGGVLPADLDRVAEAWRWAREHGDIFTTEFRFRHRSGEHRWVAMRSAPRRGADGGIEEWLGTCADVNDRVLAQHSLARSEALNRSIIESSTDSIKLLDLDGRVRFINKLGPHASMLNDAEELTGRRWPELLGGRAGAKAEKMLLKVAKGEVSRFAIDERTQNGGSRWWDVVASPVLDATGTVSSIAVVSRDITYQKRSEERANWLAKHDALTNLPNRLYLQTHLDGRIEAREPEPFALLLLDIDNFKQINDTIGHDAGDALLRAFAVRLKSAVRKDDFIARLGGDEFAVVLQGARTEADVEIAVTAIQKALREPLVHGGRLLDSRASVGGTLFPVHGVCRTELMKHADIALYVAKGARDSFELFRSAMRDDMQRRLSMLSIAKDALRQDRVEPYYQPKVDLRTGHIAGFEALLRWRHPQFGLQMPEGISAAFEDLDLAADISKRMIERVIAQMRAWLDDGVPFGHVAVNAAAAEFRRGDFAEQVLERLHKAGVPPKHFELEVTETVFLGRGAEYVERALKTLSGAGIQIALDDFGTGYASLSHLKQFPVDVIKIDRSFVRELGHALDGSAIVKAVINLGQSLNIAVVAEGVETEAQADLLKSYGCDYGQGYLYARAAPHDQVGELLDRLGSCRPC